MHQVLKWSLGAALLVLGSLAWLTKEVPTARLPLRPSPTQASPEPFFLFPAQTTLLSPWDLPRPRVERPKPTPTPAPAPVVPVRVDKSSVQFVGSSKDQDGQTTYFFKFVPTGQVLLLRLAQAQNGWSLVEVLDRRFGLQGPGGQYEVAR